MKRTLSLILLLASALPAWGQLSVPAAMEAQVDRELIFQAGSAKKLKWKVYPSIDDKGNPLPFKAERLEIVGSPDTIIFKFRALKSGKFIVAFVTASGDEPSIVETVITATGESPQPKPPDPGPLPIPPQDLKPITDKLSQLAERLASVLTVLDGLESRIAKLEKQEPGPKPPEPIPVVATKLWIIIIEETADATTARAALFKSKELKSALDKGHRLRVFDKDTVDGEGKQPPWMRSYLDHASGKALPYLILANQTTGKLLDEGSIKGKTPAELSQWIGKVGGL